MSLRVNTNMPAINSHRNLIINKRKKELLTNMREQLYKDALARNEVEKMTDNE